MDGGKGRPVLGDLAGIHVSFWWVIHAYSMLNDGFWGIQFFLAMMDTQTSSIL